MLHVRCWWYLYSSNVLKGTSFLWVQTQDFLQQHYPSRYQLHRFSQSCPVNQFCVTHWTWSSICLANRTQCLCELSIGFGIIYLQGCLQVHGQEGTVYLSLPQSLCKDFSISFVRISHNIAEALPTHQCHSLTQQMNHKSHINEELSSYLLPSPVEVIVAESKCYLNILLKTLLAYFPYCEFSFHWVF